MPHSVAINEWVQMEPQDIGHSIYNDLPLTVDRRDLKIQSLYKVAELQHLGDAQTLAVSREGLVNAAFRKKLCKWFIRFF